MVAKEFICKTIQKSLDSATTSFEILGSFQNENLVAIQQKSKSDTLNWLKKYVEKPSDAESLLELKKYVLTLDLQTQKLRQNPAFGFDRGHWNETLENINSALDKFYQCVLDHPYLLNRINNKEPFNTLCFYALKYLGEKYFFPDLASKSIPTVIQPISNFFIKAISNFLSSPAVATGKKNNSLMENLAHCNNFLVRMGKSEEDDSLRFDKVLETIRTIKLQNKLISTQCHVFLGQLEVYMDAAMEEIERNKDDLLSDSYTFKP